MARELLRLFKKARAILKLSLRGRGVFTLLQTRRALSRLPEKGRALVKVPGQGRALVKLPEMGRQMVRRIPEPVQIGLGTLSRRSLVITLEIFAGLFVIGAVILALAYGRLNQSPISLSFVVPVLEEAINRELADVEVKIDDAIIRRERNGPGVLFRLRNIRLIDRNGAIVAQAPSAAIGLSGRALLSGRIAPGSVDFIGPRLLLFHTPEGGLSLTFSRDNPARAGQFPLRGAAREQRDAGQKDGGADAESQSATPRPGMGLIGSPKNINITRTVTAAFEQARRRETAASYLTRFGVRDAIVIFDQLGKQSYWQVPDFSIDLDQDRKRSVLLGQGSIASASGPWQFNFRTEQSEKRKHLTFKGFVKDLVPSGLAPNFPGFPVLEVLNLPLSAQASIHLAPDGELLGAEAAVRLAAGHIIPPWDRENAMRIDDGELHVRYDAREKRVRILPSVLHWGQSHARISGEFRPVENEANGETWTFHLKAEDAVLAAEEFGLSPVNIQHWEAKGTVDRQAGRIVLERFVLDSQQGSINLAGTITDTPESPEIRLAGTFSEMPLSFMKRFWPKFIAGNAREWAGERITAGHISGGNVRIDLPAGQLAKIRQGADVPESALTMDLRSTGLEIHYIPGMPPVHTGDARLRINGRQMVLDVPQGTVKLPSGEQVVLSDGRFTVDDLRPDPQKGLVEFDARGSAEAVLELLDHQPLGYAAEAGVKPGDLGGVTEGHFALELPLIKDVEFSQIKLRGSAHLQQASASGAFGDVSVEGGDVKFNVTEQALEARGDVLLNGVPALLTWQRIFDAPPDKQPEMRLTGVLDEETREQLGLEINHVVRGPVPVVASIGQPASESPNIHVQADLGNAEIVLTNVGWSKPPGKSAVLSFEVGEGPEGGTELQNFRIYGDDIAIDGWIALGPDDRPVAFYFPDFSFNLITQMEISGKLRDDNIWEVRAHGPSYDGRQFFRSLFSAGQLAEEALPVPEETSGVDLTARIGAMVGFFDTTARNVSINLQKRGGRLVQLDASGQLGDKGAVAARLTNSPHNERILLAESSNAGAAFRLVGFYPRMEGGQASLKVNLDAAGPASKSGTLWVKDFTILGDHVVSEVLSNARDDPTVSFGQSGRDDAAGRRQRIPFDQLRVPFSVGGGQFVLHDSYINGPQLGATLRGNVDFKTQTLDLGGTFIPLYGLNSAFGSIPIIGNLLVGRRGEGVLGITFAVQGKADDPRVLVNPVSMVAPGIFRQIFEYTGRTPATFPAPGQSQQAGQAGRDDPHNITSGN